MGKIDRVRVSICFYGDELDPAELTRLLGMPPSYSRRKGEQRTTTGGDIRVARFGSWIIYHADEPNSVEVEEQLNSLLDRLTADIAVWKDLASRYEAEVSCGLFLGSWNEGFLLSESTVQRLAQRNLSINFDIYSPYDDAADGQDEGPS